MSGLIRLHITAEGRQTEEMFVRRLLQPYLAARNVFVDAMSVLTSKDKKAGYTYRGGFLSYDKAKRDILDWIKSVTCAAILTNGCALLRHWGVAPETEIAQLRKEAGEQPENL